MKKQYFIELGFKAPDGPETFASFYVGDNCERVGNIFSRLLGTRNIDDSHVIYLSFVEMRNGLPIGLDMIGCTLNQLGENCKIITMELFKIYSLPQNV